MVVSVWGGDVEWDVGCGMVRWGVGVVCVSLSVGCCSNWSELGA